MATEFVNARVAQRLPGQVVFIGSLSGLAPTPMTRMYNATKFGLRGFALSLREDLVGTGVGVSIVEPGFIRDAGMFATSGIDLPPGVRTKTPAQVADGGRSGHRRATCAEVFVAPLELRLAATFATVAPALSSRVQRRLGTAEMKGAARPTTLRSHRAGGSGGVVHQVAHAEADLGGEAESRRAARPCRRTRAPCRRSSGSAPARPPSVSRSAYRRPSSRSGSNPAVTMIAGHTPRQVRGLDR